MRVKARPCDPLTSKADIVRLKAHVRKSYRYGYRNEVLITLGCNLGLRASDLCRLQVKDFSGEHLDIIEQKTKKRRLIAINRAVRKEVDQYVQAMSLNPNDYIFHSQKGGHIKPKEIHRIMKTSANQIKIPGNIGSHTLRKTMAYHVMKASKGNPDIIKVIMQMFNHSSEKVTERYLTSSAEFDSIYQLLEL